MVTPEKEPEAVYELTAARRGMIKNRGRLTENETRFNELGDLPSGWRPLIGNYAEVSKEASVRNEIQIHHGFLDYLYAPELVGAKPGGLTDAEADALRSIETRGVK